MRNRNHRHYTRREFLRNLSLTAAAGASLPILSSCSKEESEDFLQKHFREMTPEEKKRVIAKLEERYQQKYGRKFQISTQEVVPDTFWAYGLELSRYLVCRLLLEKKKNNIRARPRSSARHS